MSSFPLRLIRSILACLVRSGEIYLRRRQTQELLDKDDTALLDIGLRREDVVRTIIDRHTRDPTARLGHLAQERRDLRYRDWREQLGPDA